MKFEGLKPGMVFIEKAKLSPMGGKEPRHLFINVVKSKPSENTSFQCATLDVYNNQWANTYWKSRQWESTGGGKLTEIEYHLIVKAIFTAINKLEESNGII